MGHIHSVMQLVESTLANTKLSSCDIQYHKSHYSVHEMGRSYVPIGENTAETADFLHRNVKCLIGISSSAEKHEIENFNYAMRKVEQKIIVIDNYQSEISLTYNLDAPVLLLEETNYTVSKWYIAVHSCHAHARLRVLKLSNTVGSVYDYM